MGCLASKLCDVPTIVRVLYVRATPLEGGAKVFGCWTTSLGVSEWCLWCGYAVLREASFVLLRGACRGAFVPARYGLVVGGGDEGTTFGIFSSNICSSVLVSLGGTFFSSIHHHVDR